MSSGNGCNNGSFSSSSTSIATEALSINENSTTISIDTPHLQQSPQIVQEDNTTIRMERNLNSYEPPVNNSNRPTRVQRNILSILNDARSQLGRQSTYSSENRRSFASSDNMIDRNRDEMQQNSNHNISTSPNVQSRQNRSWRTNLLSFSAAETTETLRSLITNTGGFRYSSLPTNDNSVNVTDNFHSLNQHSRAQGSVSPVYRNIRNELQRDEIQNSSQAQHQFNTNAISHAEGGRTNNHATSAVLMLDNSHNLPSRQNENVPLHSSNDDVSNREGLAIQQQGDVEDDENVVSDMIVKVLQHFLRYLPFICILFVKFIHDHLLGILDLVILHGTLYQVNKSLKQQVAKFSQKSCVVLVRDFCGILLVVICRILAASSKPDPFGLIITPPDQDVVIHVPTTPKTILNIDDVPNYLTAKPSETIANQAESAVVVTKAISLGLLFYYVAVNDLILKLITILIKIIVTMMPTKVIRHKSRARMYVLIEYASQSYRNLVPIRQWVKFFYYTYFGLEMISGILFSAFYIGSKFFEFTVRAKSLKRAIINFFCKVESERKPTKDEIEAAGPLCPICHDVYNTPVILECGHIFCDDCVSRWFKREQTCPMCRSKVSDDPIYQDGSTSLFYQLF